MNAQVQEAKFNDILVAQSTCIQYRVQAGPRYLRSGQLLPHSSACFGQHLLQRWSQFKILFDQQCVLY